jgi:hypothetical protein
MIIGTVFLKKFLIKKGENPRLVFCRDSEVICFNNKASIKQVAYSWELIMC